LLLEENRDAEINESFHYLVFSVDPWNPWSLPFGCGFAALCNLWILSVYK